MAARRAEESGDAILTGRISTPRRPRYQGATEGTIQMPDCPHCGEPALAGKSDGVQWWICQTQGCIAAFIDEDAPLTEDPRNPQTSLERGIHD